jgi:hypothetical protein
MRTLNRTTKGPAGTRGRTSRDQNTKRDFVPDKLPDDRPNTQSFQVRDQLRELLSAADTPAAAKVNAARTLAEIEGMIGRHQLAPIAGTTAPLSSLSRDQLTAELDRLRTLFELGLVT